MIEHEPQNCRKINSTKSTTYRELVRTKMIHVEIKLKYLNIKFNLIYSILHTLSRYLSLPGQLGSEGHVSRATLWAIYSFSSFTGDTSRGMFLPCRPCTFTSFLDTLPLHYTTNSNWVEGVSLVVGNARPNPNILTLVQKT